MRRQYIVRPRANEDLDSQALYYAIEVNLELGHRFLVAADDTFSLLATQPQMGWQSKTRARSLEGLRVFRVIGFDRILILYRPLTNGIEVLRVIHGSRNLRSLLRREGVE